MVNEGQILARMDTRDLESSLKRAEALLLQAQRGIDEARATQEQWRTQVALAQQQLDRTSYLFERGNSTQELLDQRRQQLNGATAALNAATARVGQSEYALSAAQHEVELLEVNIADNTTTIALLLVLIPAILMALAIVREKELGSITNFYVTPVTGVEFLIGKQLPYIAVALVNFGIMFLMALFVFRVPLKGSFPTLALGALLYVIATTGYGMLISSFTRTQIAALFGTAILTVVPAMQFSGMLTPVSSLSGAGAVIGHIFPMTYFLKISVGTFTKGLGFDDLRINLLELAIFIPALTLLSLAFLRKQEP